MRRARVPPSGPQRRWLVSCARVRGDVAANLADGGQREPVGVCSACRPCPVGTEATPARPRWPKQGGRRTQDELYQKGAWIHSRCPWSAGVPSTPSRHGQSRRTKASGSPECSQPPISAPVLVGDEACPGSTVASMLHCARDFPRLYGAGRVDACVDVSRSKEISRSIDATVNETDQYT